MTDQLVLPDLQPGQAYGVRMGLVGDRITEGYLIEALTMELQGNLVAELGERVISEFFVSHHHGATARRTYDQIVALAPAMAEPEAADRLLAGPRCLLLVVTCVFTLPTTGEDR